MDHRVDVVIVGAGLAGLRAANILANAGCSVRILEARDRLGGRILTTRASGGRLLDEGAQFVATRHRRVRALARQFGVTLARPPRAGHAALLAHPLTARDRVALAGFLIRAEFLTRTGRSARLLDGIAASEWLSRTLRSRRAALRVQFLIESELCAPLSAVSAFEVMRLLKSSGGVLGIGRNEQLVFERGAGELVARLAGSTQVRVDLECPVAAISQDSGGVVVVSLNGEIRCSRAILALPPQLIGSVALDPGLPRERQRILDRTVTGDVIKVGLAYRERWWAQRGFSGQISSEDGPFQHVMDGSSGDRALLVAFASADCAARLRRAGADSAAERLRDVVEDVFGSGPEPVARFSRDWAVEPFSRGGYASNRGLGGHVAHGDPLCDPHHRIHFAGTETAGQWRSYMEGALESAERAAQEVLAAQAA